MGFCGCTQSNRNKIEVNIKMVKFLRSIYTKVQFRIRLVVFFKKAGKFCSYEQANLMQNQLMKSNVLMNLYDHKIANVSYCKK